MAVTRRPRRYWIINCRECHTNYIHTEDGRTIGTPCKHSRKRKVL